MTWKKLLRLLFFGMAALLAGLYFFLAGQEIEGQQGKIWRVTSVFPRGNVVSIPDAKNNWQGYGFAKNFRFFSRPARDARLDFLNLVRNNFQQSHLKTDLPLFGGGIYVLQKAGKGYRLFCLFFKDDMTYWADMRSRDSLHFSRRAFERFTLNLEIDGSKPIPAVAERIRLLNEKISPFFMQTPEQMLAMIAAIFLLALAVATLVLSFGGSCPRRQDLAPGACTPGATLFTRGFGRRQLTSCCLCREGDWLVIYRFRRPYLKIDLRQERQNIVWEKNSLGYKKIRVILAEDDFQNWRSQFY